MNITLNTVALACVVEAGLLLALGHSAQTVGSLVVLAGTIVGREKK